METQCGNGGGEVRRIHVIYFLSRKGRIEHPHLIRVHHFSRNGVHLCDVKRWLSELRGKEMPESYSWSYKRRYKSGFVWQDLLDDDLITPISDNEYVLKGSEIPSVNIDLFPSGEKKVLMQKDSIVEKNEKDQKPSCDEEIKDKPETKRSDSMKATSEIEEESIVFGSESSTLTDDSMKSEEENLSTNKQDRSEESDTSKDSSSLLYSNILTKSDAKKSDKNIKSSAENQRTPASATSSSSFTKSKSTSNATSLFRNLINCGVVETNDAAVVAMKKCENSSCTLPNRSKAGELCKGDKLGGSQRIFGTCWNQPQEPLPNNGRRSCDGRRSSSSVKSDFNRQKSVPAAYKPVNKPNCSQCKKTFKPEKMHAHMKSCSGMKSSAKVSGSTVASGMEFEPRRASTSSCKDPSYNYFLKY